MYHGGSTQRHHSSNTHTRGATALTVVITMATADVCVAQPKTTSASAMASSAIYMQTAPKAKPSRIKRSVRRMSSFVWRSRCDLKTWKMPLAMSVEKIERTREM